MSAAGDRQRRMRGSRPSHGPFGVPPRTTPAELLLEFAANRRIVAVDSGRAVSVGLGRYADQAPVVQGGDGVPVVPPTDP